ncbi:MAG TPA: tRNA adenosine(34) deaminase TadA [Acidobacteriota bacterium]|nr:tRNA adenosine(34) deaminase TadA [Acidobacteriota bacterium]
MQHEHYMRLALEQADLARQKGEVPIGAVASMGGKVIAAKHNSSISRTDPTAHAEILVLRSAARKLGVYRLEGLEIYVTLEPCLMCFGAMLHARVARLVYGADDPKVGMSRILQSHLQEAHFNHRIEIIRGILAEECSALLHGFFQDRR